MTIKELFKNYNLIKAKKKKILKNKMKNKYLIKMRKLSVS